MTHLPVLLHEVLETLAPADGDDLLDGTFGGGGYSRAILDMADCRLIGVDRDLTAFERAEVLQKRDPRFRAVLGEFGDLDALALNNGMTGLDGVVLDLGVSSFQIDQAERGFSFMRDGPLDMRMGQTGPNAADVVNHLGETDLANVIFRLGEERQSRRIANFIVNRRGRAPFRTTLDLAETVEQALAGRRGAKIHPATRTFQAIRMYVNDELGELGRALSAAENILRPGGRLVVVTFHSLEDRMVKQFMRERSGLLGGGSRHMPGLKLARPATFTLPVRKAVEAQPEETQANPRARSARLRVAERTSADPWHTVPETVLDAPPLAALEAQR
ncbi:MAG: 16S rRNA (cytosine(1402)-N(4))-methyltransferase RsmH [Pseudomonadota bacterium]